MAMLLWSSTLAADEQFRASIAPVLQRHCYACHGPEIQEAQVRYDQYTGFLDQDRQLWTKVYEKLASGEMPPPDAPQPSDVEKQRVLKWIETQQRAHRSGSTRRLNRRELAGAMQDLTGLSVD